MIPGKRNTMYASGLLFLVFVLAFGLAQKTTAVDPCPSSCGGSELSVQFPFRLNRSGCGYPRFDLSCNSQRQTILTLPLSGGFIVQNIDYAAQTVWLNDAGSCLPSRLLNFTLDGSPFRAPLPRNFTLVNCSGDATLAARAAMPTLLEVQCMSSGDYMVMSVESRFYGGPGSHACDEIGTVTVPVAWQSVSDLHEDVRLAWGQPACKSCLARGGTCGLRKGSDSEIACTNVRTTGLPRSAKYGIILGLGIPAILCLIGLCSYVCGLISAYGRQRRHPREETNTDFTTVIVPRSFVVMGLDRPTIESYPKTLLGASRRLPKPADNTCPICLCEYQPQEALRTIPKCDHYFHADCVDEWLTMHSTCPLCRNTPEGSTSVTPSALLQSSLSPSSTSA
ncbi:putative RING-H2 finger protein ATL21B isoform X2 [Rhodamnia argentea]|uniref:RING-type E3 ubiquitin transferase n=1 Tax=Rhodamnia argentea TaxID=178133 RepID=A0A8B8PZM2_9MYRT|nr:putative RING-H2 finger protein ATL21B isoform X2 [Rhodamnia argentea]